MEMRGGGGVGCCINLFVRESDKIWDGITYRDDQNNPVIS